jgi:CO/xanthine dehydrogenase FAD-binding subunit
MIELLQPLTTAELREMVGSGRLIAGGTDLLVQIRAGRPDRRLIDLSNLSDAPPVVAFRNGTVQLSAIAPIAAVVRELDGLLPSVAASAHLFGSVQIRNRATIGGNLSNASPAGDMIPPLVAAGAVALLEGRNGIREIEVSALATGPGRTVLAPDEWISTVRVPLPSGEEGFFKLGGRAAMAISVVSLAWRWNRGGDGALSEVRIALGAVAPTVVRAKQAEAILEGQVPAVDVVEKAAAALRSEISPIDDVRASAWYRREVAGDLLKQAIAGSG